MTDTFQVFDTYSETSILVNAPADFAHEYAGEMNETHKNDSHSSSLVEGDRYRVRKTPLTASEYIDAPVPQQSVPQPQQ